MKIIVNNLDGLKNQPRELCQLIVDRFDSEVSKETLLKVLNDHKMVNSKANSKTTFQFYFRSLILHNNLSVFDDQDNEIVFGTPKVDVLSKRKSKTSSKFHDLEKRVQELETLLEQSLGQTVE